MPNSAQTKLSKALFRELPYNGQNIRQCHGSFNNLMPIENLPSKKYLDRLPSLNDIDLFSLNADNVNNSDLEYSSIRPVRCKYYSPHSFSLLTNKLNKQVFRSQLTLFHNNVCSLKSGVIYRQHNSLETFLKYFEETVENLSISGKPILYNV